MDNKEINQGRRRFLSLATAGAGAVAAAGVATPLVASWFPSEKAKAAGAAVEVDISKIESGQMITAEWRGKPIFVLNRTEQQVKDLPSLDGQLADPKSNADQQPKCVQMPTATQRLGLMERVAFLQFSGCSPTFRPDVGAADLGGGSWKGGFFCPCHGSKFDLAGRVYAGVPAPTNLVIPPYKYINDNVVLIGES